MNNFHVNALSLSTTRSKKMHLIHDNNNNNYVYVNGNNLVKKRKEKIIIRSSFIDTLDKKSN